jgi:ABC-type Fe3+/spermidine/putrescine transport system ATPase subunit
MTPAQKAERVRKMLAGRGLKPKSERKPAKKRRGRKTRR